MFPYYSRNAELDERIAVADHISDGVRWFLKRDNFRAAIGLLLISVFIWSAGDFFWWLGHL